MIRLLQRAVRGISDWYGNVQRDQHDIRRRLEIAMLRNAQLNEENRRLDGENQRLRAMIEALRASGE
jgi:predicted nuclease with TOPRIM domain